MGSSSFKFVNSEPSRLNTDASTRPKEPVVAEEVTVEPEEEIVEESVAEEISIDQKIKASPLAKTLANIKVDIPLPIKHTFIIKI